MRPSDLVGGGNSTARGSRSPGRNSTYRHNQSVDDSHLNYLHNTSTDTDPGMVGLHQRSNQTADQGFYRGGKTADPNYGRAGYQTSTTNPGSSADDPTYRGSYAI